MGKKKRKRKKADQKGFTLKKKNQLSLKMWLLPKLSNFLLEYLFKNRQKEGQRNSWTLLFQCFYFWRIKKLSKEQQAISCAHAKPGIPSEAGRDGIKGKGKKINQAPWNCSFWPLLYFCSKTRWTWVGNTKTTYLASQVRARQQQQSQMLFQTLKWNSK